MVFAPPPCDRLHGRAFEGEPGLALRRVRGRRVLEAAKGLALLQRLPERPGEMARRIGDLARQVLHCHAGHAFEPGAAFIGQPLCAVEEFDAVGAASWIDGRQAALRAVSALDRAIPSLLRIAADIGLRRQGSGERRRIEHAAVVGHQEQGIAGRGILDLRQRCGREPLA